MVPAGLLFEHGKALLAVWGIVLLAGVPTCAVLRVRLGFPGFVLLGIVYWAVSLYVLCFDGGLNLALGLALVGFLGTVARHRGVFERMWENALDDEQSERLIRARLATLLTSLDLSARLARR